MLKKARPRFTPVCTNWRRCVRENPRENCMFAASKSFWVVPIIVSTAFGLRSLLGHEPPLGAVGSDSQMLCCQGAADLIRRSEQVLQAQVAAMRI
jgi:hypothetical protein